MKMKTSPRTTFSERARSPLNVRRAADAIEAEAGRLGVPMKTWEADALAIAALSDIRHGAHAGATIDAVFPGEEEDPAEEEEGMEDPVPDPLAPVQRVFLAPRQLQVLKCAARGLSSEQTAAELFITVNTVKTHLRYIRKHLGASDRGRMVALGFAYGLLTVADVQAPLLREWPVIGEGDQ
jgi:DNA-binding CsgD family transcriptional regulator